jgi:hypothetical protein
VGQAVPFAWVLGAAAALLVPFAHAGAERDVRSVFFVAKSENRNQVHYGVHVDPGCAPVGPAPVFGYWRMFEHGPLATEPLLARETRAYGFSGERVLAKDPEGGRVLVVLAALERRPILVETHSTGGACVATATTAIGGIPASLSSVFAQLRWPFGVDSLTLTGRALADGRIVRERIAP